VFYSFIHFFPIIFFIFLIIFALAFGKDVDIEPVIFFEVIKFTEVGEVGPFFGFEIVTVFDLVLFGLGDWVVGFDEG
jgi:hypothetical protein